MDFARTQLGKHPRPSASASATSRKNKLQRCSVCGGLGHKSRTCDQHAALKMGVAQDLSDCLTGDAECTLDDEVTDASAVRAAYHLLNLSQANEVEASVVKSQPPAQPIDLSTLLAPPSLAPVPRLAPPPVYEPRVPPLPRWHPYARPPEQIPLLMTY